MIRLRILFLVPLLFLDACTHRAPVVTVELIDTSLSISPQSEKSAIGAVQDQISQLRRGNTLILIPITGNAANDAGGRILRLQAPTTRKPYDADLRRFRHSAGKQVIVWDSSVRVEPDRTDILGALDAARQELASLPTGSIRRLVIVSDFLEDDGEFNFLSDPSLANPSRARRLASRLRVAHGFPFRGISLCLGRLTSIDYESLSPERRYAIEAFWKSYLAEDDRTPDIHIDGLGILTNPEIGCFNESSNRRNERVR